MPAKRNVLLQLTLNRAFINRRGVIDWLYQPGWMPEMKSFLSQAQDPSSSEEAVQWVISKGLSLRGQIE